MAAIQNRYGQITRLSAKLFYMRNGKSNDQSGIIAQMREDAHAIFRAGLRAADPALAIGTHCRKEKNDLYIGESRFDLTAIDRILIIGAGKATATMAQAMEKILGDRIYDGLISVKYGHTASLKHIRTIEAGHPLPDANGVQAAQRMVAMVTEAQKSDLVIVLISGGGSALLPFPAKGVSLDDKQKTTDRLLACGATIHEINAIRKHLSAIKGGRLAQAASPAKVVALILSDVVGDDLDVIASGPTVADRTTYADCLDILDRYKIALTIPQAVYTYLQCGAKGDHKESPKRNSHNWDHIRNIIIGSNRQALMACAAKARRAGYQTLVLSAEIQGTTRDVASVHTAIAREVLASGHPLFPPACILSGGETTVVVKGSGKGGRNQEFALSAALAIDARDTIVILSAGTDGTDGPTDAAGALADNTTVQRSKALGLDIQQHLKNNDAYPFFEQLGDLLVTGPTGTNVMDLNVILVRDDESG